MKLSIIIPSFNEEKTIKTVLENVVLLKLPKIDKEIIVVDDGSSDKTSSIVSGFAKNNKNVHFLKHGVNQGKGAAVQTGIKNATGDILLIQDADLEYNPLDIPKLIEPIVEGREKVVYGTRLRVKPVFFGKDKTPLLLHFFGNKFLSVVTSVLYGHAITDMETGYKVFKREVLDGVVLKAKSFDFEPEITAKILKKGIKILELDIRVNPRGYDEGKKIRPVKDGIKALSTLIKYRIIS